MNSMGGLEDGSLQKKFSSLILTDPEKLHCPICQKASTASDPVFECENGHIACSICCPNINNEDCPFCCCSEKALVSAANYYGCREIVPLIKKHYKLCPNYYSPCPYPDCIVFASRGDITNSIHSHSTLEFVLDESFQITINPEVHNTLVLHEHKHGLQFVLIKSSYHSWMSINRMDTGLYDADIEVSILVPPGWMLEDNVRKLFKDVASSGEEVKEFLTNWGENMSKLRAALDPPWRPLNVDLVKMTNLSSPNKDKVEARLVQLSCFKYIQYSEPFNIRISIKIKNNS